MRDRAKFVLSVVIPCFNEEEVIEMTHRRVVDVLGERPDFDLEILYVDDGSTDHTEEILARLADADARVNVVSFARNFGHQPAVTAGLAHATGDAVAVIDADLQDPPEAILDMIAKWREGFDVVYGVRTQRKEGLLKRAAYAAFYRLYRRLASVEVPLDSGDFSLMDRRCVDVLNALPEKNRFVRGLRSWAGFRQTGCVYERAARAAGEPKYRFVKLVQLALDGIFNFSTAPLSLIFALGVGTAATSVLAAAVYLIAWAANLRIFGRAPEDVPGFTTLILAVLFFSGVQLISVGILGQYLGRVYQEAKMRPTYLVRSLRGRIAAAPAAGEPRPARPRATAGA